MKIAVLLLILGFPCLVFAQERVPSQDREALYENLTKGENPSEEIQLNALEIRAKIYEPNVIYILDRTRLDLDYKEEELSFSPRMIDPILYNSF